MKDYAITYPQLMNQAAALGFDEGDLIRLRDGHELAVRLVDGIYRSKGDPFLCHLVRTSSIVMTQTRSIEVIVATMLHAVYFLHYFRGSRRRGPRASDRAFLRDKIGERAESLVNSYPGLPWNETGVLQGYIEAAERHSEQTRNLLLMSLANELEEHLDASSAYLDYTPNQPRYLLLGDDYIELAEALGHGELAADLREAFDLCRRTDVPPALKREAAGSYELRARLFEANPVERLGSALRRARSARTNTNRRIADPANTEISSRRFS
jgi:hypothetical protein